MLQNMLWPIINSTGDTLAMVIVSGFIAAILGLPLGVILFTTREGQLLAEPKLHRVLTVMTNIFRSVPFIILMLAITPFTRLIMGTSIGTMAAMVPLSLSAIPFLARMIENNLQEVPEGLIEAAHAMGATPYQIISKVFIPEAKFGIVRSITVTLIALVGYSAMAGAVGGGGLGDLAIQYGYERFEPSVMLVTVVILVIFVQLLQWAGDFLAAYLQSHRR